MERFAITDYGKPEDVFVTLEAESRLLTEDHLRVAVAAFAVNPYDVSLRKGLMQEVRSLNFPYVLGNDSSGVITEVAADVTDFTVGDRVILHSMGGAYGEEVVVPTKRVTKIPATMSHEEAAGLVTTGLTAYNLVNHLLDLKGTETVVVQGASGGVGSLLVQLLKAKENRVLATASARNEEKVRRLGADEFAAYDEQDVGAYFAQQGDFVIDATKGSRGITNGVQIMKEKGTYVALNDLPAVEERLREGSYLHFGPSRSYSDQEAFEGLIQLYTAGKLTVEIAETLPFQLASVIKAHQLLEGHPPAGKLVISKEANGK